MKYSVKSLASAAPIALVISSSAFAADNPCFYWGIVPGHTSTAVQNADTQVVLDVIQLTKSQVERTYLPKAASDFVTANLSKGHLTRAEHSHNFAYGSCFESKEKVEQRRQRFIADFMQEDHKNSSLKTLFEMHGNWMTTDALPKFDKATIRRSLTWKDANKFCSDKGMDLPSTAELKDIQSQWTYDFRTDGGLWGNEIEEGVAKAASISLKDGVIRMQGVDSHIDVLCVRRP